MSKQRRRRLNRHKRTRNRRSFIRNGVEQLESRVLPGGFLDLLAGAAFASNLDLLPAEQFVPEEIEAESKAFTLRERSASTLLQTGLSLPDIDLEPHEERVELKPNFEDLDVAPMSRAATNTLVAATFVDSFFTSNQFVDTIPHLPVSPSPPLTAPSRSFNSPISQLGSGVGSGSGQGYNVTGAELPQASVGSTPIAASSIPAWMMGEGEGGALATAPTSAPVIGTGGTTATATATSTCGGSASGSAAMSASGYVSISTVDAEYERDGQVEFNITFSGYAPCGFTVDWSTSDGSATAGSDYAATTGSTAFSGTSGETVAIQIGITNDSLVEGDEDFTVTLDSVHDGSGGAVAGNIDIGYGAGGGSASGSGGGSASGSGSVFGATGKAIILYDDYDVVWELSGSATEGGSSPELTVTVSPSPRHAFEVHYEVLPDSSTPGASTGDVQDASSYVFVYLQADKLDDPSVEFKQTITVVDDFIVEETEEFEVINVSVTMGTGGGAPDTVHLTHPTNGKFEIIDNEWRWVGTPEQISYASNTVAIDAHWYPDASFLVGRMEVESQKTGGGAFEGPNSLKVTVSGEFYDDAFTGAQISSQSVGLTFEFICDKTFGTVSQEAGSAGAGASDFDDDGELRAGVDSGDAEKISNPAETIVNVQFAGDSAVADSLSTTLTGGAYGAGIEFTQNHSWGDHAGVFNSVGVLKCKKGSV
ncbi:MAG: hypothetical protein O3C40_35010 [Planctomycetota bacterium]|nr:hypothetical protein [Planctomycetota bacterium]